MIRLRRALSAALLLLPALAFAEGFGGQGRLTTSIGWRLTPNTTFERSAAAANFPTEGHSPGGPVGAGTFGYFATDVLEICIDLFVGGERLGFGNGGQLQSVTYGAALGARAHLNFDRIAFAEQGSLYAGVLLGPTLVNITGGPQGGMAEGVTTGYLLSGGLMLRLAERWGVNLDYRLMAARGPVPGIGTVNGGGSWFTVGLTYYFPSEPPKTPAF